MRVRIEVLAAIEARARREAPRECCGLLIGTGTVITEAVACANAAEDPLRRYLIPAEELFHQIHRCRALGGGVRVVGAYHSHPRTAPEPSPTDLAEAFAGFTFLIAGPVDGSAPFSVRAFELVGGSFVPVKLVPEAPGG